MRVKGRHPTLYPFKNSIPSPPIFDSLQFYDIHARLSGPKNFLACFFFLQNLAGFFFLRKWSNWGLEDDLGELENSIWSSKF